MHKSAVAAGQGREQEGRLSRASGEKSSRSEGEKDEFVGSEKRNSLGRRRRRRLPRSLSPLSPFRFYDRRRDPRSLSPRSPSLARRSPAQFVFTKWGSILSPSLPPSLPPFLVSTESGRPSQPVERLSTLRHAFRWEVACSRAQMQRKVTFISP